MKGSVTLTFDDGLSKNTELLLDILDKEDIKVTFFIVGSTINERNKHLLKRIHDSGHIIGGHTMTHANLVKLSSASVVKEITSANSLIENIIGCKVKYFRPPYGSVNTEIRKLVNQLDLTLVMWNIDPRDWDRNNSKEEMLSCYRSSIKDPKDHGYIILQHDMRKDSVELVPDIIELCKNSNFKVVSLDSYLG